MHLVICVLAVLDLPYLSWLSLIAGLWFLLIPSYDAFLILAKKRGRVGTDIVPGQIVICDIVYLQVLLIIFKYEGMTNLYWGLILLPINTILTIFTLYLGYVVVKDLLKDSL